MFISWVVRCLYLCTILFVLTHKQLAITLLRREKRVLRRERCPFIHKWRHCWTWIGLWIVSVCTFFCLRQKKKQFFIVLLGLSWKLWMGSENRKLEGLKAQEVFLGSLQRVWSRSIKRMSGVSAHAEKTDFIAVFAEYFTFQQLCLHFIN